MATVHKIELVVIDTKDELTEETILRLLGLDGNHHRHSFYFRVINMCNKHIGEWTTENPLNFRSTLKQYIKELFKEK